MQITRLSWWRKRTSRDKELEVFEKAYAKANIASYQVTNLGLR